MTDPESPEQAIARELPTTTEPERLPIKLLNPEQGATVTGLSESTFYELLRTREIQSFKVGRRRVVPVAAIDEWIERRLKETEAGL